MFHSRVLRVTAASLMLAGALAVPGFASASTPVSIVAPSSVEPDVTTAVTVKLPNGVAAVEGRVLVDSSAAELVGVVASGGKSLSPTQTTDGFAFGVYGMTTRAAKNDLSLVLMPHVAGQLELRVIIDAAANKAGRRIALPNEIVAGRLQVGRGNTLKSAPSSSAHSGPRLAAQPVRGLFGRPVIGPDDLDLARAAWYGNRDTAGDCSTSAHVDGDANGDGCVDIVDLQLIDASQGDSVKTTVSGAAPRAAVTTADATSLDTTVTKASTAGTSTAKAVNAAVSSLTFTVTSTSDTPDAIPGDGACADSQGRCTLRAALTESNQHAGTNRINFNLTGTAPVTIQLGSSAMSLVGSSNSSVIIDGYSQPGSQPNTAQNGFNGIPGVFVKGAGYNTSKYIFYVARSGNTIRGIAMGNAYRGVFLDTANSHDNYIVGDWFGFNRDGTNGSSGHSAVQVNNGAHDNYIGTSALADRNIAGNQEKAMYAYGTGTNGNIFQNNVLCIRPDGGTAPCSTGIDFDFGPKSNVIGGTGPNEHNVVGPTFLNGIELSHGWDPNTNHDSTPTWQVNNNIAIGNWVGFRVDGSYDPNYVSAQYKPAADNGQALHMHDGSNYNTFESNFVGAAYDGVTIAMANCTGDIVRNNIIGVSPLGQPAPMARYGIYFFLNTRGHTVEGNVIRNAATAGIALIDPNVKQVLLSKNIVSDTNGPAIYMAPDPNDPTTGADDLVAPPRILSANPSMVSGTGIAGARVEVFRASKPAGQTGLPIAYVGAAVVASDGTWSLATALAQGDTITATQSRTDGNTSVLSTNVSVGAPPPPPVASFTSEQQQNSLTVNFTDTSSGGPKAWTWNFGDGTTSQAQNPSHTYTSGGDFTVSLTATNDGGSDTTAHSITVTGVASGTVIAADSFNRSVSGWGSADIGGPYTFDGNVANFDIVSGMGQITLPKATANRGATLGNVSATDVDAVVRVAANKVAAGGNFIVYLPVRQDGPGTNAYRPKLIFNADGTISVGAGVLVNGRESAVAPAVTVPGLTQAAGKVIWLRTKVSGTNPTTVKVKAWADGTTEPSGWQFSATNNAAPVQVPGSISLRAYASSGLSNASIVLSFDDLSVTATAAPPPPTGIAADTFEREQSGTWGSADNGGQYSLQGTAANYSVHNGSGQIVMPRGNLTRSALLDNVSATDVDVQFRVATDKVLAGGPAYVYMVVRRNGDNEYRPRLILNPNGNVTVSASRVVNGSESPLGSGVVTGISQSSNSYIWIRAQVTGTNPTTINDKAWADGTPEPSTWQFTATDSSAALQAAGSVGVRAYLSSGASVAPLTVFFDDYSIVAPKP
jgi:CSLREA domain-containing protein